MNRNSTGDFFAARCNLVNLPGVRILGRGRVGRALSRSPRYPCGRISLPTTVERPCTRSCLPQALSRIPLPIRGHPIPIHLPIRFQLEFPSPCFTGLVCCPFAVFLACRCVRAARGQMTLSFWSTPRPMSTTLALLNPTSIRVYSDRLPIKLSGSNPSVFLLSSLGFLRSGDAPNGLRFQPRG